MSPKGDTNKRYEIHGDSLTTLRTAFTEIVMPEHRHSEAAAIISEVLTANAVQEFHWYKTPGTAELACYWDQAPQNLLWITATEVHIPSDETKVKRPTRSINWDKQNGAYVGWLLPGAERGAGGGKRAREITTVLCPETFIGQPSGSVCPDCDVVHQAEAVTPSTAETIDHELLQQLATQTKNRLSDLFECDVPHQTGIYALWHGEKLLYVGISVKDPADTTNPQAAGVAGRLNTYRKSPITSNFTLAVALRYILPTLTTAELAAFGTGELESRDLETRTKAWVHENVEFSVVAAKPADARLAERLAFASGLPGSGRPMLNR